MTISKSLNEKLSTINKKVIKRNNLFDSAYDLFMNKGIESTSIDDIVKKAGVAKGTFYLYFKDKYDIIDRLILAKSSNILNEAVKYTQSKIKKESVGFEDGVIYFADYIIESLKENKKLLRIIHKNLSWGIYRRALANPEQYTAMNNITNMFISNIKSINTCMQDDPEKILFMIIELTGSVCYSSIILEEPDTIENMKPILFKTIRKMIND